MDKSQRSQRLFWKEKNIATGVSILKKLAVLQELGCDLSKDYAGCMALAIRSIYHPETIPDPKPEPPPQPKKIPSRWARDFESNFIGFTRTEP